MKIYARQVPPEHQESPLYMFNEWPENVYVFGNRYYTERAERIDEIRNALENIAEDFAAMQAGHGYTNNLHAVIWYELPRDSGEGYTRAERLKIIEMAQRYTDSAPGSYDEREALTLALEMVTGEEYETGTICGCCQGDWQRIIYPARYGENFKEMFETEYFNTGTEWIIHDSDEAPETPDEIDGYSHYCHTCDARAEIAAEYGVKPDEVQLYSFDGWTRAANWRAV